MERSRHVVVQRSMNSFMNLTFSDDKPPLPGTPPPPPPPTHTHTNTNANTNANANTNTNTNTHHHHSPHAHFEAPCNTFLYFICWSFSIVKVLSYHVELTYEKDIVRYCGCFGSIIIPAIVHESIMYIWTFLSINIPLVDCPHFPWIIFVRHHFRIIQFFSFFKIEKVCFYDICIFKLYKMLVVQWNPVSFILCSMFLLDHLSAIESDLWISERFPDLHKNIFCTDKTQYSYLIEALWIERYSAWQI